MNIQNCLITGGSGFIGQSLVPALLENNVKVTILTRNPAKTKALYASGVNVINDLKTLSERDCFDAVVNLAGQSIADKRWTGNVKEALISSRIQTTRELVQFMERVIKKPEVFISGSAIGYYGLRGDEPLNEEASGDDSFSSQLCQQWETVASQAEVLGIRCCYLRTGVVLGKGGGALSKMLPPFKLGLGGPMGNGQQYMSWIHMDDMVGIILHLITQTNIRGPVNATAPTPQTNQAFSKALGKVLKRPAVLPLPAFVLKLLMGEMGEELLLNGQRVVPEKLVSEGYTFSFPALQEALTDILKSA